MAASISEAFIEVIRKHLNDKADDLATGCAGDFADYRYRVGIIEGLAIAEREWLDLVRRATEEE